MPAKMLHIYQNSPLGRERLMQSACFCSRVPGLNLVVYIPTSPQFSMNLLHSLLHIQLDQSYVAFPATAREHVDRILADFSCRYDYQEHPSHYSGMIPPLPSDWTVMACPRILSKRPPRLSRLANLGPKVRNLAKNAPFPLFIPSEQYKPWQGVTAFFGGSNRGAAVVRQTLSLCEASQLPLHIHTQLNEHSLKDCEDMLRAHGLWERLKVVDLDWRIFDRASFEENLFEVSPDNLVVIGAAAESALRSLVLGSKLELVQSTLPNPLLVVGPGCTSQMRPHEEMRVRNTA